MRWLRSAWWWFWSGAMPWIAAVAIFAGGVALIRWGLGDNGFLGFALGTFLWFAVAWFMHGIFIGRPEIRRQPRRSRDQQDP